MPTHPRRFSTLALAVLLAALGLALSSRPTPARDAKTPAGAKPAAFEKAVKPFLAAHCAKCHTGDKPKGDLTLADLSADIAAGKDLLRWTSIAERLKAGDMPPPGEAQPDPDAIKAVTDWIDAELARAGKAGAVKPGSLRTGNHIPHELLFDPKAEFPLDAPPRVWRFSPFAYLALTKDMKGIKLSQPFALPPGDGFKDQAGAVTVDASTVAQLLRNAEQIVDDQLGLGKKGGRKVPDFQPLLNETAPATRAQIDKAVTAQFDFALKRKPTAEELKRFADLHEKNVATGGAVAGTRVTLMTVLLLPEAVFRLELGAAGGPAGFRQLTPRELAFAVAYALTDRPPDKDLLAAADAGRLKTKEDVAREVNRLFADPKADKTRVPRFFREYFGYAEAVNVFKNDKDFNGHDARALVDDTDRLVAHIVAADKDVFRELLTTTKSFVAYSKADAAKKKLDTEQAKFEETKKTMPDKVKGKVPPNHPSKLAVGSYNLTDYALPQTQPVDLPKEQRAGVLTQPAWLVATSENTDNHAIKRGKWVRERLLGGTVPDLPIGVDAQLPEDPHKTLRERMTKTTDTYCWQCHAKMNPIGLAFENFDHFGRWRDTEIGKPVDASAVIDRVGDKAVEGKFANSLEMVRKLAQTDRARQVFVRYAFRYWMGREENLGDGRTLRAADEAFVKSGGSMKALIVSLLTSESFLYRTTK